MKIRLVIAICMSTCLAGCSIYEKMTEPGALFTPTRTAYLAGRTSAQNDIHQGKLVVEDVGMIMEWNEEEDYLLKHRYGIEDRRVAGDDVDDKTLAQMNGYNDVAIPEITRRFGTNIWITTDNDAQLLYKKKYPNGRFYRNRTSINEK